MLKTFRIGSDTSLGLRQEMPFTDVPGEYHAIDWRGDDPIYMYRSLAIQGIQGRPGEICVMATMDRDVCQSGMSVMFFSHFVIGLARSREKRLTAQFLEGFDSSPDLGMLVEAFNQGSFPSWADWALSMSEINLSDLRSHYAYTLRTYSRIRLLEVKGGCGHAGLMALLASAVKKGEIAIAPCGIPNAAFAVALVRNADSLILNEKEKEEIVPIFNQRIFGIRFFREKSVADSILDVGGALTLPYGIAALPYPLVERLRRRELSRADWLKTRALCQIGELATPDLKTYHYHRTMAILVALSTVLRSMVDLGEMGWSPEEGLSIHDVSGAQLIRITSQYTSVTLENSLALDDVQEVIGSSLDTFACLHQFENSSVRLTFHG
ncbi:hypothetical protein [Pseudodesulfovibrio sp.]|uniref:hypothetical protein n=1 Tax=unclassified Pseudodesulfovibrio TaxID=2661612 RepID=UPI003AFFDCED